jgi:hypothetical protein
MSGQVRRIAGGMRNRTLHAQWGGRERPHAVVQGTGHRGAVADVGPDVGRRRVRVAVGRGVQDVQHGNVVAASRNASTTWLR